MITSDRPPYTMLLLVIFHSLTEHFLTTVVATLLACIPTTLLMAFSVPQFTHPFTSCLVSIALDLNIQYLSLQCIVGEDA